MRTLALLGLLIAAAPAREAVVLEGETLPRVAARTLGSAAAASELQALNHLGEARVAPGTHLLLPGPERERAVGAIASARSAVAQAPEGTARSEAGARLADAETLLSGARYADAAAQADGAWKLLAQTPDARTRFAVDVAKDGATRVRVQEGVPVRVEAEGRTRAVRAGESVTVRKGEPPNAPEAEEMPRPAALEAPVLLGPAADARLGLGTVGSGAVGPLRLSWRPVSGAVGYLVELRGPTRRTVRSARPDADLASLAPGRYRWSVRAVGTNGALGAESERGMEVSAANIKLEVQETPWK